MVEYNIQVDRIHMVMMILRKCVVSDVMGGVKGMTASKLRERSRWLRKRYWEENIVWSPRYFVSTVGIDKDEIRRYVRWQQRNH
jgi:putative transposase